MNQNNTMLSGAKSVSKVSTKSKKAVEKQEEDLIDQHMFVEVLAVIALEIPYLNPQPNEIEKVLFDIMNIFLTLSQDFQLTWKIKSISRTHHC